MNGMMHLYIGDGKGKTTAAVGLCTRASGRGRAVIFTMFLKGMESGETISLEKLGVLIIRSNIRFGWLSQMDAAVKSSCREKQRELLLETASAMRNKAAGLVVLDEVLDALNAGMIEAKTLQDFIKLRDDETELVMTGRNPPLWLLEQADYVSDIKKVKHPFDRGIKAREGIEQ
ncbi:MAG: cob(I)yrinic acid a,c-diamide adenosyltransferase [Treponema sp.]|jgi:cob(I)alamin adenosyltransferase|nr:cob(I)yrinic acid a,c-diamide adenosyltransferase [Treponema sp.]